MVLKSSRSREDIIARSPRRPLPRREGVRRKHQRDHVRHGESVLWRMRRVCSPERKLMNQHRDAIRDSRIATYFVEECLEPAIVATVTVLRNSAETADATMERIS